MKKALILPALFVLLIISSCKEKEKQVAVVSVTIDNGAATNVTTAVVQLNATLTLKATVLPDNATSREVTWNSSQPLTATVAGGVVTPLKEGETIISATAGGITAKCTVTVLPNFVPLTKISFNTDKMTLVINNKKTLTPLFTPANASDQAVVWNSDKEDIAVVSQSGEIEAKKTGTCKITVKSSKSPSIAATCGVEVVAAPISLTGLTAIPSDTTVEANSSSFTLKYRTIPANATNVEVAFESSDVTKATVTETGAVTAKAITSSGSPVIITVKSKDAPSISATCRLTIVTATVRVSSITISPPDAVTLSVGQKKTLEATVMPLNATNRTVTWISSDESKATVSNTGEVTANAPGEVYITASAKDGSNVSAAKTVTVTSNDASLTAMTLGAAKHAVTPVEGQTVNLKNVERTFYSSLTAVPVTISAAAGATVKTGTTAFSGGNVDFTNPVVFTVTAADGVTTKTYTVGIPAYNAATNPYGVYTAAHLNDVRNDKGGSYLMMNDITLPERNEAGKTATGINDYIDKGWLPIAHDAVSGPAVTGGFTGIFDGGSHSIDNLYLNRSTEFIGLFGATSNATIRNLGVNGVGDGTAVSGLKYVGFVAGRSDNSTITQCFSTGNIAASPTNTQFPTYCGGLVGYTDNCTISKCYATGNVTASNGSVGQAMAGGLIGQPYQGSITNCYATGGATATAGGQARSFAGGLVGFTAKASISNSYATGNIVSLSGLGEGHAFAGGLIGIGENITLTNNYRNSSATIRKNNVDAAANDASTTGITAKPKAEMQNDDFKGLLNNSGSIWGRDTNKNDGLPYIQGVGVGK